MQIDLFDQEFLNVSSTVLLCGALAAVLMTVILYLAALCDKVIEAAALSALKTLNTEKSGAAEKAVSLKMNAESIQRRLKTAVVFQIIGLAAIFFLLYCYPIAKGLNRVIGNAGASLLLSGILLWVLLTVLCAVFGSFLPKRAAVVSPEKSLLRLCTCAKVIAAVFTPLSLLAKAPERLLSMIFVKEDKTSGANNDNPTEEKILMMLGEGEENGTIEENTGSMIENVLDFDDKTVGEIMTHRKDVVAVREDDTLEKLRETAVKSGRSRIPVYRDDIDDIIGVIYIKDLLSLIGRKDFSETIDKTIIHDAVYVPESKRCSEMFEYMTAHKTQIAVVVDEFGGTGGIITMEDLIESILGSIQDEYDNEDDGIRQVNEYSFQVDGATPLDEIEELTGISFEQDESDTIAGVMLDRMGHIPKSGEHPSIMINGTRFTVLEVDGRRISRVLIVKYHKNGKETIQNT